MLMEPVIENMTLNEIPLMVLHPKFFLYITITPNSPFDKKDFRFEEILDDSFRIRGENLRSMEHEEVQKRCYDEIVRDTDHESGNLLNFPTFPVTNEFASVCIQDEENIDISIVREREEVLMEDVELAEDHDVDQPNDQSDFVQQITLSSISDGVKRE
nr:hypothetical protein [Tanacetum cinerariifolium]